MSEKNGTRIEVTAEGIQAGGGEFQEALPGVIGRTMFDQPGSKDHTVSVALPAEHVARIPSGALVRIESRAPIEDGERRQYLGVVTQGPFAEPDGLRADAPILVTMTVRGGQFMPRYHGRIQITILGEELGGGGLVPSRFRPAPNSPVFLLSEEETAEKLKVQGDVRLGLAVGYEDMPVCLSTTRKDVLPRHTVVLGTTGAGKSTTISRLIGEMSKNGVAVVVFDTEGEYTILSEPTDDESMRRALQNRGLSPEGLANVGTYHLLGRETTHPDYSDRREFGLEFSRLSPYAVMEILGLNDAQQERFLRAYDLAKQILAKLKIYPANKIEELEWLELDELETGCPRLTLQLMYDIVRVCAEFVAGDELQTFASPMLEDQRDEIIALLHARGKSLPSNIGSWRRVQGAIGRLGRLRIFDSDNAPLPDFKRMTEPGRVSIIDVSGVDSRQVTNLMISQLLSGLWKQQEANYQACSEGAPLRKVVVVVEEAHEFLGSTKIKQMQTLLDQVTRIARRGRKRWLGLVFVSQSPEDLPDEIISLVNNFILHKITNANVIARLRRTVGSIDEGLWERLPDLELGIAIVKMASLARPMLVAIDPTPHNLLMVD